MPFMAEHAGLALLHRPGMIDVVSGAFHRFVYGRDRILRARDSGILVEAGEHLNTRPARGARLRAIYGRRYMIDGRR
mgnify:CR=1 FL=1